MKNSFNKIPRDEIDIILFNALRSIYQFQLGTVKEFNLNYEDIYIMQFLLRNGSLRMSELAAELNIPISTATRVIDRLEKRDLLFREKDKSDKRNIFLKLKQSGINIVKKVDEYTYTIISDNLGNFKIEDIEAFMKTAINMNKILGTE